ncbi:MAG: nucleoside deaminase [Kiloniellales bacterium]|nr:nucleoside deaminase [Kiloniellales bacterium]
MIRRRTLMAALPTAAAAGALSAGRADARTADAAARGVSVVAADELGENERAEHEAYLAAALDLAAEGPGPFATVIVDRTAGRIVCQGVNRARESRVLHGEIVALLSCADLAPPVDWRGLTLYTTAEPCPMCMSAIVWHRIPELVYGTSVGDLIAMGVNQFHLDSPTVAASAPFYRGRIVTGVLRERADAFYRDWASRRR